MRLHSSTFFPATYVVFEVHNFDSIPNLSLHGNTKSRGLRDGIASYVYCSAQFSDLNLISSNYIEERIRAYCVLLF